MGSRPAVCGTKGGFNRHKRTLGEEPCDACREAENAARRKLRQNPVQHRFCGCGREIRKAGQEKCAVCRKPTDWRPCIHCGEPAYSGNRKCVICAEVDDTAVCGWVRLRPGGVLVGSHDPHNDELNCTAHDWCDKQQREEDAA